MKYTLAAFVNLITLAVGITLGLLLSPRLQNSVQAKSEGLYQAPSTASITPAVKSNQKTTPISPMMTGGSAGFYIVLAHQIQSDQLVVNGYDLLKLENAQLQLLSRFVPQQEIQNAVNASRASEVFTVTQPPRPQSQPAKPPVK